MVAFRTFTVTEILGERDGLQRMRLDDGSRAYALTDQIGDVAVGDDVVVNTTAVDRQLGTGGWHVVHWNTTRRTFERPGPGHIMKLRYSSLQTDTGAAEDTTPLPATLDGIPVGICSLHSQMACVAVVLKHLVPQCRLIYVMTDAAALPIALSDLVVDLRSQGLIDLTVTAGHAFGGDCEAVNTVSALLVAAGRDADAVIVAPGPGVVGTGSRFGHSAVETAGVADSVAALGGRPIMAIRYSSADRRERHRGVSHHLDAVTRLLYSRPRFAAPDQMVAAEFRRRYPEQVVQVVATPDVGALLAARGLQVHTMGRDPSADPGFFAAAGATGAAMAMALGDSLPKP